MHGQCIASSNNFAVCRHGNVNSWPGNSSSRSAISIMRSSLFSTWPNGDATRYGNPLRGGGGCQPQNFSPHFRRFHLSPRIATSLPDRWLWVTQPFHKPCFQVIGRLGDGSQVPLLFGFCGRSNFDGSDFSAAGDKHLDLLADAELGELIFPGFRVHAVLIECQEFIVHIESCLVCR